MVYNWSSPGLIPSLISYIVIPSVLPVSLLLTNLNAVFQLEKMTCIVKFKTSFTIIGLVELQRDFIAFVMSQITPAQTVT